MKRKSVRALCLWMTMTMLMGTAGCGQSGNAGVGENSSEVSVESTEKKDGEASVDSAEGTEPSEENTTSGTAESVVREKTHISDLYQYANEEWMSTVTLDEDTQYVVKSLEEFDESMEMIYHWINADPNSFEEQGMRNTVLYANQLASFSDYASELQEQMKQDLERIDQVSNLEELYELYQDPYLYRYNRIWYIYLDKMDGEDYQTIVEPYQMFYVPEDKRSQIEGMVKDLLVEAGLSEKEAKKLAKSYSQLEASIQELYDKYELNYIYWDKYYAQEMGLQIPVLETMQKLGLVNWKNQWLTYNETVEFYNDLYQEKNLSMLKDHFKVCYLISMNNMCNPGFTNSCMTRLMEMNGMEAIEDTKETIIYNMLYSSNVDATWGEYYSSHVVGEDNLQKTKEMSDRVITSVREMIKSNPWLSTHGKELAQRKINHLNVCLGTNSYANLYDDVTFTDSLYENLQLIKMAQLEHWQTLTDINQKFSDVQNGPIVKNAYYNQAQNSFMLGTGELDWFLNHPNASFEEELGAIGMVMAHEIGHAYDFYGSSFNEYGAYDPWMTDKEYESYSQIEEKVTSFFDEKKTQYGNTIDGELVASETFADLMAMECCLNILDQMENADYEAFFLAYAKYYAMVETAESEEETVKDCHLPARERVNYIVGQFEQFYDTFEVDMDSPYYVAKEDRCWDMWKNAQ